jgi:response regulator of citrate/malate metabolism
MENRIAELKAEREHQVATIEAAKARIARIDAVLDAYRLLVDERVLPESDIVETEERQAEGPVGSDTVVKIQAAIDQVGEEPFAVSDIATYTSFSRQTVRRVLSEMVENGKLRVVEAGFRRKPTIYEVVKTE